MKGEWTEKEIFVKPEQINPVVFFQTDNIINLPNSRCWFFFIDEMPYANWSHPCKYVFINVSNGRITSLERTDPPMDIENMDILHRVRPTNRTNPDSLFKIPIRINSRNVNTTENEYAIIISGGYNSYKNWERYWNDCSAIYKA